MTARGRTQGSPYVRFKRAIDRGTVTIALAAAHELPHLNLADALALVELGSASHWPTPWPTAAPDGMVDAFYTGPRQRLANVHERLRLLQR